VASEGGRSTELTPSKPAEGKNMSHTRDTCGDNRACARAFLDHQGKGASRDKKLIKGIVRSKKRHIGLRKEAGPFSHE